tara:strand:+ start:53 stop:1102 length:1050 start_codon:yes stop_codon:yes gene_type:complete
MKFTINNSSNMDMSQIQNVISDFYPYAEKRLGFDKPVSLNLVSDVDNSKDPFGKTAYYDPENMQITIFVDRRHVKDILRSFSHELIHHAQNCRGDLDKATHTGPGYAQKDPHMRKMEAEAYLLGNGFLVRDYEDQLKEKNKMATLNEEQKNRLKRAVSSLLERTKRDSPDRTGGRAEGGRRLKPLEEEETIEEEKDEDDKKLEEVDELEEAQALPGTTLEEVENIDEDVLDEDDGSQKAKSIYNEEEELEEEKMPMKDEPPGKDLNKDGKKGHGKVPAFLKGDGDSSDSDSKDDKDDDDDKEEKGKEKKDLSKVPPQLRKSMQEESLYESTNRKKKEALFERLMDKWIK